MGSPGCQCSCGPEAGTICDCVPECHVLGQANSCDIRADRAKARDPSERPHPTQAAARLCLSPRLPLPAQHRACCILQGSDSWVPPAVHRAQRGCGRRLDSALRSGWSRPCGVGGAWLEGHQDPGWSPHHLAPQQLPGVAATPRGGFHVLSKHGTHRRTRLRWRGCRQGPGQPSEAPDMGLEHLRVPGGLLEAVDSAPGSFLKLTARAVAAGPQVQPSGLPRPRAPRQAPPHASPV